MKKLLLVLTIAATALCFAACGDNSAGLKNAADSSASVVNPPDNSSATNPSLADTAYSADSTKMKRDSSK